MKLITLNYIQPFINKFASFVRSQQSQSHYVLDNLFLYKDVSIYVESAATKSLIKKQKYMKKCLTFANLKRKMIQKSTNIKSANNTTQPTYMITLSIIWLSLAWPAANLNTVLEFWGEDLCKHDGPRPAFAPKPKLSCEQKITMNMSLSNSLQYLRGKNRSGRASHEDERIGSGVLAVVTNFEFP